MQTDYRRPFLEAILFIVHRTEPMFKFGREIDKKVIGINLVMND